MTVRKTKRKQFKLTPRLDALLKEKYGFRNKKGAIKCRYSLATANAMMAARAHLNKPGGMIPGVRSEKWVNFTISKNATWSDEAFLDFDWIRSRYPDVYDKYVVYYVVMWYLLNMDKEKGNE